MAKAYFAAGCFWGVQQRFSKLTGVTKTAVGYMGGTLQSPDYRSVCTGQTGHAEVVEIEYDPTQIDFSTLCIKCLPFEGVSQAFFMPFAVLLNLFGAGQAAENLPQ